ncbi:MAG: hypothetical protein H7Y86_20020 [Rhizobacter sp.]|nr:hypothetical protein [Ferruginibacter sp.]
MVDADLNDYGFRNYYPQIGRFPQLDPLTLHYPILIPYQYASCDPIANIDLARLFLRKGEIQEAMNAIDRCLEIDPVYPNANELKNDLLNFHKIKDIEID